MTTDTTPRADHAARIHAATVTIHEAVEDQLLGSSEVSAIVALDTIDDAADALDAARRDAEARAERLANYVGGLEAFVEQVCRNRDVYLRVVEHRRRTAELQPGDLDAGPGDTEGEAQP